VSEQPTPSDPAEREPAYLRIGELARRTGTSPELLRAWERRYGLLRPARSQGGYRLYTAADEARIRRMRAYLARGVAAAEAARLEEARAHDVLDQLLAAYQPETVLRDLLLPYLHDLGERWARGEVSVAQEHFASNLLRGRLLGLARGWGRQDRSAAAGAGSGERGRAP
jgi:MerR family transcriptional regulator, light-induced transcriptional regulator